MDLLLFTMPNCGQCTVAKTKLEKKSLKFIEIDVSEKANLELAKKYNIRMAGTIIDKDTGEEFVI